jgi:hypothetical protein
MRLLQTVYGNVAPIDPVGARRREEHDYIGNLLGGAEPFHRETVTDVVVEIVRIGEAVAVPAISRAASPAKPMKPPVRRRGPLPIG